MKGGKFEYRVRCDRYGAPGHEGHAYGKSCATGQDLAGRVLDADEDPVMGRPGNRGCSPWHGEMRFISPWTENLASLAVQVSRLDRPVSLFEG